MNNEISAYVEMYVNMEKLKEAGLYGGALVQVSGSIVARYNNCLAMLGLPPTALDRFTIDGMGWSPEIALEKDNNFYLNIGEANPNAIIISPQQEGKPVHMPFHSFDRDIMTAIFAAYPLQIRDITKDSAIVVHLDQEIDTYYEPFDLLRYTKIAVHFNLLDNLDQKQAEQQALIDKFEADNNFINRQIHQEILASAKAHGDLRQRKLQLPSLELPIRSFYTKAFGGIFVLRDFATDIIVFEDKELFAKAIENSTLDVNLFHISHHELTVSLVSQNIAQFDIKKAAKTDRYDRIKKHIFAEHLGATEHPIPEILESHLLFKKYLNTLEPETRKSVMSVELYNQRKIIERDLQIDDVVDLHYTQALLEPHKNLEEEHKELIWRLLAKIVPKDPLHLYWYEKEAFYNAFKTWKPGYQDWVIKLILKSRE